MRDLEAILKTSSVRIEPHLIARDQATTRSKIKAGAVILSIPSLISALLPDEKARRCDHCSKRPPLSQQLRKCTGCSAYWYCDTTCQTAQWKLHHKFICKSYQGFVSSNLYQSLPAHLKLDSLLLSHFAAYLAGAPTEIDKALSPSNIFLSLLPGPVKSVEIPPICGKKTTLTKERLGMLYARFGNNNFAIHSHLTTYGHGIFPLASRLFNHSCLPNAAARYIITGGGTPVIMEIVALRAISEGEEITIPYLDPALVQSRQQIFKFTYGFTCSCPSCQSLKGLPAQPQDSEAPDDESRNRLSLVLREFSGITSSANMVLHYGLPSSIPVDLCAVFHEGFLTKLSEAFAEASHEGHYEKARDSGLSILALYTVIYPQNYPQIGMHVLELAKTAWNAIILSGSSPELEQDTKNFLTRAERILEVYGREGDEDGPFLEIQTLKALLNDAQ
ncbi:SET domain-containing protein [Pluteus cervinus]|uniref:SET domain-containing protein n=1 Tax=Pluteus cervinus TaxID=181527 RepID=A0ACD3AG09_9AGAR|nr:SET domain-containing protein [Pluteus cervinus]